MAQIESKSERREGSPANAGLVGIGAFGTPRAESLGRFQTEFFDKVQEINRHWMERAQSEMALAVEFASKVASTRSIPDAAAVYQEWASQRMKLAAEDANYALSAARKLMDTPARLLQGEGKGPVGST
jgi:hypothetical protein